MESIVRDEHFRAMFVNSPLPTIVVDDTRKILDANRAACELAVISRNELIGETIDRFTADVDIEDHWRQFMKAGAASGIGNVEVENGSKIGLRFVLKTFHLGLHLAAAVAVYPGGVETKDFHYSAELSIPRPQAPPFADGRG